MTNLIVTYKNIYYFDILLFLVPSNIHLKKMYFIFVFICDMWDLSIKLDTLEFLTKILCTNHLHYTLTVGLIYIFHLILNFIFILIYMFIVFVESWWITIPSE